MDKPTFYTAFANNMTNIIPNLSEEALKISDLFQELVFKDKLYYMKDELFDVVRLEQNFLKYGDRINIFYFSGHCKEGGLQLMQRSVDPADMSNLINTCLPNVKLIFLNACETFALAQQIITTRKDFQDNLVIISYKKEIEWVIAERFATLLFTQIGQLGTYRDAYEQAKSVIKMLYKKQVFKEFDCIEAASQAADDFTIGYIEIKADTIAKSEDNCAPAVQAAPPKSSIIGEDTLTRDALTTNYVHEVVESIAESTAKMKSDKLDLLVTALNAAKAIAKGQTKTKETEALFEKAAAALPGIPSAGAFDSLINTEINLDKESVQKLIKSKNSGKTIGGLLNKLMGVTA